MKSLIFLSLLLFLSCYKEDEKRSWKCTDESIVTRPGWVPDTITKISFHEFTDNEVVMYQRMSTTYSYEIYKGDTVQVVETSSNCDPALCVK